MCPLFIIVPISCLFSCQFSSAQAIVLVKNDYQPDEIKQQADYYAHTLGFDSNVYILINFSRRLPRKLGGFTQYQDSRPEGGGYQVHITISSDAGRSQQMQTLAHEMVHAQQFITGKLIQCDHTHLRWDQQTCERVDQIAYNDRPWEREAKLKGALLYRAYQSQTAWLAFPKVDE